MYPIKIPTFDMTGKSVVVTGAGSGIGRAAAMIFAYYGAGVTVADISAQSAQETVDVIKENGGKAISFVTDVSDEDQVESLVKAAEKEYGGVDVFVSNAGIGGASVPILEQSRKDFEDVIGVNLKGAFFCGRQAAKQMIKQDKGGRIIFTASIAAIEGGGCHGPYGAAKGGLCSMVRTMAYEWAQYGITVNAVSPGLTDTGISEALRGKPEELAYMVSKIPLRRMACPEEIASVMLYLATDSAAFVTGTTYIADGGATIGGIDYK